MARGTDETVRAGAGSVSEGGQELQQDGRGMSLRVRGKRADDVAGKPVECLFAKMELGGRRYGFWTRFGWWFGGWSRLRFGGVVELFHFVSATLKLLEGRVRLANAHV